VNVQMVGAATTKPLEPECVDMKEEHRERDGPHNFLTS